MIRTKSRWRSGAAALGISFAATLGVLTPAQSRAAALPPCPQIFGHGGYPTKANPWERDKVRQPNNPPALAAEKRWGASGVEADVQLTRNGTKAVMWHNGTTLLLSGNKAPINTLWWNTGADKLNGRTIEVGPYKGVRVYTLRQYLDAAYTYKMVPLIEIKSTTEQSLLNSDPAIRNQAWSELLDPIKERIGRQEIMLYTHDTALSSQLTTRADAAGLSKVIAGGPQRPKWPDTVAWEEPPPSATGNYASWQKTLDTAPRRMATSWPSQMHTWLQGRCTPA